MEQFYIKNRRQKVREFFLCLLLFTICISAWGQSAESCPAPAPDGLHTCPLGDVAHYTFDLSSSATATDAQQIEGSSGSPCCGDELNSNAKCNVVEVLLNPQTTSLSFEFYGNLGTSGSIKFSSDRNDVCSGGVESLNDFDRDSLCVDGNSGEFFITICKPGTADYCVDIQANKADGFGDQVVLLDDVVNCQYEVNVNSTDTLYNITWRSLTGEDNDTMLLYCPGPGLDCLRPVFTPPGNLNTDDEYIYEVCGEFYSEQCGPTGILICDTVNIIIIPQIIVELEEVIVCTGEFPWEVNADVDPDEPTFEYYWYDEYDGPAGGGNLLAVTNSPDYDVPAAGRYSVYVLDTNDDAYNCTRTFTFNFDVIEEFDPVAVIDIIDFDECNLTVTFSGMNSQDNYLADNLDYAWDFGDGAVDFGSGLDLVTHTYDQCDAYTVYLYVEDPDVTGDCYWAEIELDFNFDDEEPVLTCPDVVLGQCSIDDVPIYADWNEFISATGAGFFDNCTVNESSFQFLGETDNNDPDGLPCPMMWERTYYVEDMCGNATTCIQQVEIRDTIPPVIDPEAQDEVFECERGDINSILNLWLSVRGYAQATDNCTDEADLVWTYDPANPMVDGGCGVTGEVEVTFYVTDECGNSSSTTASFIVEDNTDPEITCPPDLTLECPADTMPTATGFATATDLCDDDLDITYDDVVINGCGGTYEIERTWTATDDCGLSVSCVQLISVVDNTPPVVTTQAQDITIECDLSDRDAQIQNWLGNNGFTVASDGCSGISWSNDYTGLTEDCGGTGTASVTYTIIDDCGNTVTSTGTITIIDITAPTVTCTPVSQTFECNSGDNESIADQWVADNMALLQGCSSDACGGLIFDNNYIWNYNINCGQVLNFTVEFYVRDECGNVTTLPATITFEDTSNPIVNCDPVDIALECNGSINETEANQWNADNIALLEACSSDECGTISVSSDYVFTGLSDDCGVSGEITVNYTIRDNCGNEVTRTATLTITDNTAPDIVCPPDVILDCPAATDPSDTGTATGTDDCGSVTITYLDVVTQNCGNTYEIERTWTAEDECGLTTDCVQLITVVDNTPPALTPAQDLVIPCNENDQDAVIQAWLDNNGGASATDACNTFFWDHDYNGISDECGATGTALVTFIVEDACGNTNTTSATVTVIDDSAPNVSCTPISETYECELTDNESIADQWVADNITLLESCSSDPCGDLEVTSNYLWNYNINCGEVLNFTVEFYVRDVCGNVTTLPATISFEDTSVPIVDCDAEDLDLECNASLDQGIADQWNADNIALLEACSSDACGTISVQSDYSFNSLSDECGGTGELTVNYTISDDCGNEILRTATITITDNTEPEIICPADVVLQCPADIDPSNTGVATGSDDCGPVSISYEDVRTDLCGNTFEIERTWTAVDLCGLTTECVQIIAVIDDTPPAVTPAEDLIIQCNETNQDAIIQAWLDNNGGATASDACNSFDWTNDFDDISDDCAATGTATVVFTVEDACGNFSTTSATVTVIDDSAPVVSCTPVSQTYECEDLDNEAIADQWVADNIALLEGCSSDPCGDLEVSSNYAWNYTIVCGQTLSFDVEFYIEDICGNITTLVATITFEDTSNPIVDCDPEDIVLECSTTDNLSAATAWNDNNMALLIGCSSDACSDVTVTNNFDFGNLSDGCGGTGSITVTYTIEDVCGNTVTRQATLTVEDNLEPEIICPPDIVLQCPADIDPSNTGEATGTDDCGAVSITYTDVITNGCGNTFEIERTWTAEDQCGLTSECVQIIAVIDDTPPTITPAQDLLIPCDANNQDAVIQNWLDNNGGATANDACNGFNWDNDYTDISDDCGATGTVLVTFTVEDDCGNISTTSATLTVIDDIAPTVSCDPISQTFECNAIDNETIADQWVADNIDLLTNCSSDACGSLEITSNYAWNYTIVCGQTLSFDVEFYIEDECGNVTTRTATITFQDTSIPIVDCDPESIVLECDAVDNNAAADAWNADNMALLIACSSDACSDVTVENDYDFANLSDGCGATGSITVTYTITDVCGNVVTREATLTVEDNLAPEIVCPPDVVLQCPADTEPSNTGVATGSDDCGTVEITYLDVVNPGCGNTFEIERTWTAEDLCGQTTQCVQIITVIDDTPPVVVAAQDLTLECDLSTQETAIQAWLTNNGGATATDECNEMTWENDYEPFTVDCGGAGTRDVIFTVTDACGNFTTTIATVTVIDGSAPTVTCDPTSPTIECDGLDNNESMAEAWDSQNINDLITCSSDPCGSFEVTSDYDWANYIPGCGDAGTLTVEYAITDDCGNVTTRTATITFVDNSIPVVTCAPEDITLECSALDNQAQANQWNDDNLALLIDCSSDACGTVTVNSSFDYGQLQYTCGSSGTLDVTYTIEDNCAFIVSFTVTLTIVDNTPPEIECPEDITLDCPADTDPSNTGVATGTDDCGGVVITYDDDVAPGCGSSYVITRTWTATDECNLTSTCIQVITVEDITEPEIICPADVTIAFDNSCGLESTPTDLGEPVVTDACSSDLDVTYSDDLDDLSECNGTGFFTRTWRVEDECGNVATCDQIITVIDITEPEVTCPADVTVEYDNNCDLDLDPGVLGTPTVTDNCDQNPEIIYEDDVSGLDQCNATGLIVRTWTITDACGNETICIQNITVIDVIAPEIICPDITTINYDTQCEIDLDPGIVGVPTITDNCDVSPTIFFEDDVTGLDGCNGTGTIIRTWTVTDACGNSSTCEQLFIIQDITAPEVICPDEVTVTFDSQCSFDIDPSFTGQPTVLDNCDANPEISYEDDFSPLTECNGTGTFVRTWTVTDVCGNVTTCVQSIVVQDNTNPIVECPPDITLALDEDCSIDTDPTITGLPVVTDNCDQDPLVEYEDDLSGLDPCNGAGEIIRIWTITDVCGNETECIQSITIIDDSETTIVCPDDVTLDCPADTDPSVTGFAEGFDNCGIESVTYEDEVDETCPGNAIITRTWTATNNCGETAECIQIITVVDETPPAISCPDDLTVECDGNGNTSDIVNWLDDVSASDDCSLVFLDDDFDGINGPCEGIGSATVTFVARDECGRESTCEATITIEDTTPPVADEIIDLTLTYLSEIPNVNVEVVLGEADLCDPNPLVTFVGETDNGGSGCAGDPLIITRAYSVVDCSDNSFAVDQEITVEAEPLEAEEEITEILCTGENTGEIFLTISGGTEPYSTTWSDAGNDDQTELTDLFAGTYTVTITDDIGCELIRDIVVAETDDALNVVLGPQNPVICIDGEVILTAVASGGVMPYSYEWSAPTTTEETITISEEDTYFVTVTDFNGCSDIAEVTLRVLDNPEIFNPGPLENCEELILPAIDGNDLSGNEAYYTGPQGTGVQYEPGDIIDFSGTMYIYDESGTEPNCVAETEFEITIFETPNPIAEPDAASCDAYTLPPIGGTNLSGDEAYYTQPNGEGDQYLPGDIINDDITLYAYDIANGCSGEDEFVVSIVETPEIDQPDDVNACNEYSLPDITGIGISGDAAYFTETNQGGTRYNPGDIINEDIQLFIYTQAGSCFDEKQFNISILPVPELDPISNFTNCDVFELPTITGTNLTGNEAYYDGPGGTGNSFDPGDFISETTTLYAYDIALDCPTEVSFTIEIVETPEIDPQPDRTECDFYTLEPITGVGVGSALYYTESGGNGTSYSAGEQISESITIYMYVDAGDCSIEERFNITILETPDIDPPSNISGCDEVPLPAITGTALSNNVSYFTESGGNGDVLAEGDLISSSTTIYVYDNNGECFDEEILVIEIVETPDIEPHDDVVICDEFILPEIQGVGVSGASYFTMPDGQGDKLMAGDAITSSTTLYMYLSAGDCGDQESFDVEIMTTPDINPVSGMTGCDALTLPEITGTNLTGNEAYYTEPGGNGTILNEGQVINSSMTVYIYDEDGICFDEESFEIEVVETPDITPIEDLTICDSYTLPEIQGVGVSGAAYYTQPGGAGNQYQAGEVIDESTTLYIYLSAGDCGDEEMFSVSILETPDITPISNVSLCDVFELPEIEGERLSGNESYYTEPGGNGTRLFPGEIIENSIILYLFDASGICSDEEILSIEILSTPIIDPVDDIEVCDSYVLPEISGSGVASARYYTESEGQGDSFEPGTVIDESMTLYIYVNEGACVAEESFNITIGVTPAIDEISDVSTCDQFVLPEITGTAVDNAQFFTGPLGTGSTMSPGEAISESMTVYVYIDAGDCSVEESFEVVIELTPSIDNPGDQFVCDQYILGDITGNKLSGNESYYAGPNQTGGTFNVGDVILPGTTVYIYDGIGACSDEQQFTIIGQDVPEAVMTGGGRICSDLGESQTLTINFANGNNWILDVFKDGELYESINTDQDVFEIVVTEAGEYTIGNVSNASGCASPGDGNAIVEVYGSPRVTNIVSQCNPLEPGYKVSFEISGGDPTNYLINGNLVNNPSGIEPYVFTSETLQSGTAYQFEVTDINGCEIIEVAGPGEDCGCITEVGVMNSDIIELCGESLTGSGVYNDATQQFDFNDALMFVLHEGSDTALINILSQSLDANFSFDPNQMNYGQTYYISAVVGNDLGDGFVDLTDECLAVAIGQPVVWYTTPTAQIGGNFDLCLGEQTSIDIELTGVAPWSFQVQVNDQSFDFTDINSSTFTLMIDVTEDVTISINSVMDAHCTGETSGEAFVNVFESEAAEIVEFTEICNLDFKGSIIDLDTMIISGSSSGTWTDLSNSGASFVDNILDFHGVEPGEYQFEYKLDNTGGLCEVNTYILTITVLECACPEINIGEAGPFCNTELDFDLSTLENDSDEGSWSISETPQGSNAAQINGSILQILGADPGTYGLTFSLEVVDPLCTSDTTIFVEIMDQLRAGTAEPPVELCEFTDMQIDLYDLLSDEDVGGQWELLEGNPGTALDLTVGLLSTSELSSGTYRFRYSISSIAPCNDEGAEVTAIINPLPIAEAGQGFELNCDMQEGRLDGTQSVGTQFQWITQDGNIISGANSATPLVDQPGWYYLEMMDGASGCGTIDSVLVTIDPGFPNADAGPNQTLNCAQLKVTIDATNSSEGDYQYTWIGPDGDPLSLANNFLFETDVPGSYILIIEDVENQCINTDTVLVEGLVNYPIAAIANPDILNCYNEEVVLDASGSTFNSNIVYNWTALQGGIITGDARGNSVSVSEAGQYVIEVLDTVNFCSTLDTVTVTMDREDPTANAGSNFTIDCITTEVNLNGANSSTGTEFSYSWTTAEGNIISGSNTSSPTVNATGVYYLEIINTRNGCSSLDSVIVDDDIVPIVDFDLDQINPCFGDTEGLIAVTNVVGGIGPFQYSLNNGSFTEESVWDNLRAGNYTVTIMGSNGCSLSRDIEITEGRDLQIDAGEDQRIDLGDTVQLQAEINIDLSLVESIVWSPVDANLSCVECISPLAWPFETTLYTATVTDIDGCTEVADVRIFVDRRSKVYAPNIFSPNDDGKNDFFTLYSGNQVDIIDDLKIFDRWGELIYENANFPPGAEEFGWDGTFKGFPVDPAVFVWYATVTLVDGSERVLKGDVTLIK
ncbi:T9SS type B sorting domain-containing protein [Portibacter marinus]|uniref:T9SS type B sorting domain-containing protein n=1 Tax=Portibacter marinus TaxID=2898660 RepID=UPI001F44187E|nr:gliding motility-associated C-terminal domain-containing protein [Portibacter marinus]